MRLPIIELAERLPDAQEIDLLFVSGCGLDSRYERVSDLYDDMSRRLASPGVAIGLYWKHGRTVDARALLNAQAPLRTVSSR